MYSNQEYVELMTSDKDIQKKLLGVMNKYGNDTWWISENTDHLTYKQFQEDTMLVESTAWQKATEKLLEREISFTEFKLKFLQIKQEVIDKYRTKHGC